MLLLGVVLFFGLTRTEVGRDGVRMQLERQFDARFEGTLHIDRLDGNLVNTLFARGVQVRGPEGNVAVQADSVVLRPTWLALVNQTLALRSIDVYTAQVTAEQTDRGMPLVRAFARTDPPEDSTGPPVSLSLPYLRLHDARLETRSESPPPQAIADGWVADLLNTTVELPEAEVQVQWSPAGRYADVDLRNIYHPRSELTIKQLAGRLQRTKAGWELQSGSLSTPNTSITAEGSWAHDLNAEAPFALSVQAAPFDVNEWQALLPRLPSGQPITLNADVRGPLSDLVVEAIRVQQGEAELTAEGTAVGFPNDIDVEAAVRSANLTQTAVATWLPQETLNSVAGVLPLSGEVYARGQLRAASVPEQLLSWRPGAAEGRIEVDASSAAGRAEADAELEWAQGTPMAYDGTLQAEQFLVDALLPGRSTPRTQITGRMTVNGTGWDRRTATAEARLTLMPSVLAGGVVQGAQGRLSLSEGMVEGAATVVQADAQEANATWTANAFGVGGTDVDVALSATAFDASPWGGPWQRTQLSGRAEVQAQWEGGAVTEGTLSVQIDSSSVTPADPAQAGDASSYSLETAPRAIPAHTLTATLAPPSPAESTSKRIPRLTVQGDVLSMTAGGAGWTQAGARLVPAWTQALAQTAAYERAADGMATATMSAELRRAAGLSQDNEPPVWQPPAAVEEPFTFWSEARLHRPDVIRAWIPSAPRTADDLALQTDVYAAPDSVRATAQLTAQTLRQGATMAESLDLHVDIGADDNGTLPERLRFTVRGDAKEITTPAASVFEPQLRAAYAVRQGTLSLITGTRNNTGPITLEADLRALDLRNELVVKEISATAGDYTWRLRKPSTWQLYANRVTGTPLELTSSASLPNQEKVQQSIVLDGDFSPRSNDALDLRLRNVQLLPLSQLAGWSQPLGGQVNGAFTIEGTWATPVGTGDLAVDELSFDRRLLGDLSATTRYVAGAPDVELDLALAPTPQVDTPQRCRASACTWWNPASGAQHAGSERATPSG